MRVFILIAAITVFSLAITKDKKETKTEVTKSLKILNIHDTKDAKILLA